MAVISFAAGVPSGLADRLTGEVLTGLESTLQRLAASSDGWLALLSQVFDAPTAGSQEPFSASAERLRQELSAGAFSIRLELRSGQELQGGYAAYAAAEAGFGERIYLNADWATTASVADLTLVLLEELGHAFDQRLNGGSDTAGDEGELFAARVLGTPLDGAALARISQENDGGVLQLDGQAVAVEFSGYNAATTDTDGDGVFDATDLDDDNDGILDTDEQLVANSLPLTPKSLNFNYAQNTLGFQSFHSAALVYQTGDKNDPAFLFDGKIDTELRVHSDDVYEFGFLTATGAARTISAGSSFTLTEGSGSNDAKIAVLASTDSTDSTGNTNNASGGGKGWTTIRSRFNGIVVGGVARTVNTVADLEALFLANGSQPLVSLDGKSILLYVGASDSTRSFTTSIPVGYLQLVGLVKHGGWADLSLSAEVNLGLDTDSDGIPNSRDLDSDNDGISDLYESLGSKPSALAVAVDNAGDRDGRIGLSDITAYNTANPSSTISTTLSPSGVWQFLGAPAVANDGSKPIDSDGDGVSDFVDLDSDGDGIPDTIEARASSGYNVNDGNVIGEDSDGDGVIDRFDSKSGFGGSFTAPVNTDSSLGGDGTTTTNAGSAAKVVVDQKVDSEANALGAFDGKFAKLNNKDDQLVLDLGSDVPVGTTITIRAKRDGSSSDNKLIINQSSADGKTLANTQSSGFTAKDVLQDITYTTTGTAGSTTRYISLKFDRKKDNLFVDGLTWQWGTSTPGFTPDYLDLDSDNDGINDATESGLVRTGVDANNDGIDDGIGASYQDPDQGCLKVSISPVKARDVTRMAATKAR